jgi:hypothetical protein
MAAAWGLQVALALGSLGALSERVAVHFGRGGWPDAWASRAAWFWMTLLPPTVVFVVILAMPRLLRRLPWRWVSVPRHRDYWRAPERREEACRRLAVHSERMGTAVILFTGWMTAWTVAAHRADPVRLSEPMVYAGLAAFLLYVTAWVMQLYRLFALPDPSSAG